MVTPEVADAAHNARNSLDWAGSYSGSMPCAECPCPGIKTTLILSENGEYELQMLYLGREADPTVECGRFEWLADNTRVRLGGLGFVFFVTEGRVVFIPGNETHPDWAHAVPNSLQKVDQ